MAVACARSGMAVVLALALLFSRAPQGAEAFLAPGNLRANLRPPVGGTLSSPRWRRLPAAATVAEPEQAVAPVILKSTATLPPLSEVREAKGRLARFVSFSWRSTRQCRGVRPPPASSSSPAVPVPRRSSPGGLDGGHAKLPGGCALSACRRLLPAAACPASASVLSRPNRTSADAPALCF